MSPTGDIERQRDIANYLADNKFDLVINLAMRDGGSRAASSFITQVRLDSRIYLSLALPLTLSLYLSLVLPLSLALPLSLSCFISLLFFLSLVLYLSLSYSSSNLAMRDGR